MNPKDRVKLRFGTYRTPRFKYGDVVFCERFGEVTLVGLSGGRIPWPMCRRGRGRAIALIGDLVRAVRQESALAVQHWWGVGASTVLLWRKALDVGPLTEGTRALRREYGYELIDGKLPALLAKSRDPERRAKIAAARRGKPRPPPLPAGYLPRSHAAVPAVWPKTIAMLVTNAGVSGSRSRTATNMAIQTNTPTTKAPG
jgi:hypothetical protein